MDKASKERIDRLIDSFFGDYKRYEYEILCSRYDYSEIKTFLDYCKELLEDIKRKFCNNREEVVIAKNQGLLALGYAELITNNIIRKSHLIQLCANETVLTVNQKRFQEYGESFRRLANNIEYANTRVGSFVENVFGDIHTSTGEIKKDHTSKYIYATQFEDNWYESRYLSGIPTYQFIYEYDDILKNPFCLDDNSDSSFNKSKTEFLKIRQQIDNNKLHPDKLLHCIDVKLQDMYLPGGSAWNSSNEIHPSNEEGTQSSSPETFYEKIRDLEKNTDILKALYYALKEAGNHLMYIKGYDTDESISNLFSVQKFEYERYKGKAALNFKKHFSKIYKDSKDKYSREFWIEQRAIQNEHLRECTDANGNSVFSDGFPIGNESNTIDFIFENLLRNRMRIIMDDPSFYTYIARIELIDRILAEFDDIESNKETDNQAGSISIISNGPLTIVNNGRNNDEEEKANQQSYYSFEDTIPPYLRDGKQYEYWLMLQQEGYLDEKFRLTKETTQIMAKHFVLGFNNNKPSTKQKKGKIEWKPFEKFWGLKNLRSYHANIPQDVEEKIDAIFRNL